MLVALREAANVADYERLQDLLDGLTVDHSETAASMREMLARYAYDEIAAHVEERDG
jgi:hypothetical protein